MRQAIIFANGHMDEPPDITTLIESCDLIIAADGGAQHCKTLAIQPHVIIGDLDSLDQDELRKNKNAGVKIIPHPTRKDETDLELGLRYAMDHAVTDAVLVGALGARWDMTIANVLLMAYPLFSHLNIRIVDGAQELFLIREGKPVVVHAKPRDSISLIPLIGDAFGIVTHGFEYPLKDETLYYGSPRGVSNTFIGERAEIFVKQGLLLCILNKA